MSEYERLKAQKDEIVKQEYDKIFNAGILAGREQAAAVCDARAIVEREKASKDMDEDSCSRALSREAAAKYLAAAIRAMPKP